MKFSKLYAEGLKYWPDEIDISDGSNVSDTGGLFPNLSLVWDKVEKEYGDDNWEGLISWGIFGAYHSLAIKRWHSGIFKILKSEIDPIEVETIFSENIYADNSDLSEELKWSEEFKSKYENDLKQN